MLFFNRGLSETVAKNEQRITANEARVKNLEEEVKSIPVIEAQLKGLAEGQEEVKQISLANQAMNSSQNERLAKIDSLEKGQAEIKIAISDTMISKTALMWTVFGTVGLALVSRAVGWI